MGGAGGPSGSSGDDGEEGTGMIGIRTPSGVVQCSPDEIIPKRFGLQLQRRSIVVEYEVPRHGLLAHHPIEVDLNGAASSVASSPSGALRGVPAAEARTESGTSDVAAAKELQHCHGPWLAGVDVEQLAALVARLRAACVSAGATMAARAAAAAGGATPEGDGKGAPRRPRVRTVPPTARASKRSKDEEIRKVYRDVSGGGDGPLSLEVLRSYFGDYLGFGQAEVESFYKRYGSAEGVTFDGFREGYSTLNPFMVARRKGEVIVRKPGALGGLEKDFGLQLVNLDTLDNCEVYICTPTAQVFTDFCKGCAIMIAPCESSVFVRDCEDCVFWLAVQQLRTNNCKRCTFHLYTKTEPIIEESQDLSFAPWCASYPKCVSHFTQVGFDPQRNFWNAVFDFTGSAEKSHWRILPLEEVVELKLELDERPEESASPDSPGPFVTHEALCAEPCSSGQSSGESIANIPQTRPDAPPPPTGHVEIPRRLVQDATPAAGEVVVQRLRTPGL
mmetsp:Transcript_60790/g.130631  ORF Transcript_60790/g.130631 Transcript_60790/m.130631 type:complete len:503 (+) Transcript_60790:73-1581(+)